MSTDPYRGDRAALAVRCAALDEEIATLEARLLPVFWERVAPHWRIAPAGSALEGADPVEARQRRVAVLEDAITRARTGLAAPELPPAPEAAVDDEGLDDPWVADALYKLASSAPDRAVRRRRSNRWGVRVIADGVPIDASVERWPRTARTSWHWNFLTTTVPTAKLRMKPEGLLQDLLELVGLGKEIEIGDRAFDALVKITGDERCVALLTTNVRRDFADLSELGTLGLRIDDGWAHLVFYGPLGPEGASLAMRILAAMHRAPSVMPVLAPLEGE